MQLVSIFQFLVTFFALSTVFGDTTKKRYVFRLDNIQDFYNSDMQVALIDYFITSKVSVSLGIIGGYFTGNDKPLYAKVKSCVDQGYSKCLLANRGNDATYVFANAPSVASAKAQVKMSDDRIKSLFNNYNVEVMAPSQNSWGQNLVQALKELGYSAITASTDPYSGMSWNLTARPIQVPQQVTIATYSGRTQNQWVANPVSTTVADCEAVASRGEDCVVMIDPDQFVAGGYTLEMLKQLITALNNQGWVSISFHQIILEAYKATDYPTAQPTQPVLSLNTYLTIQKLPEPILPDVGKKVIQESYDMILPDPISASSEMSIISQSQNSTTKQWMIVVESLLSLPMDGFLSMTKGNSTILYQYVKELLTTAVKNQKMTSSLRSRASKNQFTTYESAEATKIEYKNANGGDSSSGNSSSSAAAVDPSMIAGVCIAGIIVILIVIFLCQTRRENRKMQEAIARQEEMKTSSNTINSTTTGSGNYDTWFGKRKSTFGASSPEAIKKQPYAALEDDVIDQSPKYEYDNDPEPVYDEQATDELDIMMTNSPPKRVDSEQRQSSSSRKKSMDNRPSSSPRSPHRDYMDSTPKQARTSHRDYRDQLG